MSFGTVEERVGKAECLEQLTTETGILLQVRVWEQVHAGGHCGHFLLEHEVPAGGFHWLAFSLLGFSAELTNSRWTSTDTSSRSCLACT